MSEHNLLGILSGGAMRGRLTLFLTTPELVRADILLAMPLDVLLDKQLVVGAPLDLAFK